MHGSILSLLHSGEEKKKKRVLHCNNLEDPAKKYSHLSYNKISGQTRNRMPMSCTAAKQT
jgi:hypothetical protein